MLNMKIKNITFEQNILLCHFHSHLCKRQNAEKINDKKETFNYILKINKMLAEFSLCKKKDIGLFCFFTKQ